jgi:hypothetical protein
VHHAAPSFSTGETGARARTSGGGDGAQQLLLLLRRAPALAPRMSRPENWDDPAGASPVRVSIGAPGSRLQPRGETPEAAAERRKPLRWEKERGPQHEANPAASSEKQRESRAGHVAAKATSDARRTEAAGAAGLPRCRRHAKDRVRTGEPSARRRAGRPYKPKAKSNGVQQESEGRGVDGGEETPPEEPALVAGGR